MLQKAVDHAILRFFSFLLDVAVIALRTRRAARN